MQTSIHWGKQHLIVVVDYFIKWEEAIPTFKFNGEMVAYFIFHQFITIFGILKQFVMNHGSHFQNKMMIELTTFLGFKEHHSSFIYLEVNAEVEDANKTLNTIINRTINSIRSNWNIMLYP